MPLNMSNTKNAFSIKVDGKLYTALELLSHGSEGMIVAQDNGYYCRIILTKGYELIIPELCEYQGSIYENNADIELTAPSAISLTSVNIKTNGYFKLAPRNTLSIKATNNNPDDLNSTNEIKASNMLIEGTIKVKELIIDVKEELHLAGSIMADGLTVFAYKMYCGMDSIIRVENKLLISAYRIISFGVIRGLVTKISADQVYGFLFASFEGDKELEINSLSFVTFLGVTVRSPCLVLKNGLVLLMAGIVRSFDYISDSIINLNIGIHIPELPMELKDVSNSKKAFAVFINILKIIFFPLASLLQLVQKIYDVYKNGKSVFDKYRDIVNNKSDSMRKSVTLKKLNTMLATISLVNNIEGIYKHGKNLVDYVQYLLGYGAENTDRYTFKMPIPQVLRSAFDSILPVSKNGTGIDITSRVGFTGANLDSANIPIIFSDVTTIPYVTEEEQAPVVAPLQEEMNARNDTIAKCTV